MEINEINFELINNKKINEYKKNKLLKEAEEFNKEERLKSTLLNIDSKYRNKEPKNIIQSNNNFLKNNPLTTYLNSKKIKINIPNHNFEIGDKIIIQNVIGYNKILSSSIYLLSDFRYLIVYFPNHNIDENYKNYIDKFQVNIEILNEITSSERIIGNIPINSFIGPNEIEFNNNILIPNKLLENLNVNLEEFNKNYFLIKLPYNYAPRNDSDVFYKINKNFKITFMNIGGIPNTYINSNYPINYSQYQGFQIINSIDKDNIYFESKITSYKNITSGGNKVIVNKVIDTLPGFPNSNEYTINLKKSFTNVVRVELVSTEIPFLDFLIKNNGPNKNDSLYWQHFDDGDSIYSVNIPEGNYDGETLISTLGDRMNAIERVSSTLKNPVYNLFKINFNSFSQKVEFIAFKEEFLPNSITINEVEINNEKFFKLTIKHPNNLVEVGDVIEIDNAERVGNIPANAINNEHTVFEINKQTETYSILLEPLNTTERATEGNGGNSIKIKSRAQVRFLFNRSDSMGRILGFKDVGMKNAITNFKHIVSNFDNYIYPSPFDQVGNSDNLNNILNITGDNMYVLMHINDYETIVSNSDIPSCFAKILLTGTPGDIQFNTFINHPMEFDIPISTLDQLRIKFTFSDNTLPDFRNLDNSFTLRIVEKISSSNNNGINSNKQNILA